MISSKKDLKFYLEEDKKALHISKKKPSLFGDEVWKFEIVLRKYEYFLNTSGSFLHSLLRQYYHFLFHHMSIKLNFNIPPNVFREGLAIVHYGTIVVNKNSRVGANCRLLECVNIGAVHAGLSPQIGDNVFIGTGAKILGNIKVASNTTIGAGAVVVRDILEEGTTWVGVPAHKVEHKDNIV